MSKNKNEIQVADNGGELSALVQDLKGLFQGAVTVRQELIKADRLKLTQKSSSVIDAGKAMPGDFYCSSRDKNYGKSVSIIPLMISESASLLFNKDKPPRKISLESEYTDGQILCSSSNLVTNQDGVHCVDCSYGEYYNDWGSKDDKVKPKCNLSIDVVCLVGEDLTPIILSFRKSDYKAGKALANFVIKDETGVPFANRYTLFSETATYEKYVYQIIKPDITKDRLPVEEFKKIIPIATAFFKAKNAKNVSFEADDNNDFPV